jgi:hypothetical protein
LLLGGFRSKVTAGGPQQFAHTFDAGGGAELVRFFGAKAAWWTHSANRESGPNHLSEMTVIHVHQKASDQ